MSIEKRGFFLSYQNQVFSLPSSILFTYLYKSFIYINLYNFVLKNTFLLKENKKVIYLVCPRIYKIKMLYSI